MFFAFWDGSSGDRMHCDVDFSAVVTPRVQVHNHHILTQNLYQNHYYPNAKYLLIGYLDPKPLNPIHSPLVL